MSTRSRLIRAGRLVARPDGALEALFDASVEASVGATANAAPSMPVCGLGCAACGRATARRLPVGGGAGADGREATLPGVAVGAGAAVELSVTRSGLVRIAGSAFGLPLGGLLSGGLLGAAVAGEGGSMLLGLAGLAAGLAWVRLNGGWLVRTLELELRPCARAGAGTGDRSSTGAIG